MTTRVLRRVLLLAAPALGACSLPMPPDRDATPEERARRIEAELAPIRDLEFTESVPITPQDKDALQSFLEVELDEEWSEQGSLLETAYKKFGLVPAEMDLRAFMVRYLREQVAGYYDPEQKRFFTIEGAEEMDPEVGDDDIGPWIESGVPDFVIAHELTHALDDQHFDLAAMDEVVTANADAGLAYSALVEGNAMSAAADHALWRAGAPLGITGPVGRTMTRALAKLDPDELGDVDVDLGGDDAEVGNVPGVVSVEMIFPYIQGWRFQNELRSEYGWWAVDEAFRAPPESTEQILHPERFIERLDRPATIRLAAPPDGWSETFQQTLGLLRIRVLAGEEFGAEIDGWDGDRYALWETPEGGVALAWLSVWDGVGDAADFASTYRWILENRYGPDGRWALVRRGERVAVVQEAPVGSADAAARRLLDSEVTRAADDRVPEAWWSRALRWPVTARGLDYAPGAFEVALLGGHAFQWRDHDGGHRVRLLDSLAIHSENNADRAALWLALGLVGFSRDRTLDTTYARVPLVIGYHGIGEGEERRSAFTMALHAIRYANDRGSKQFDVLWGGLTRVRWGERVDDGERLRILFIPIPGV